MCVIGVFNYFVDCFVEVLVVLCDYGLLCYESL